jgi:glutamine amidotransferase
MIAVIDYDIGNINSVLNMLQRLGIPSRAATTAADIEMADRIILPGNGAFDACMMNLKSSGLIPVLKNHVLDRGKPLLGICVGAQMLGHGSAEGVESGLGWVDMRVERFPVLPNLRIPHMSWNQVVPVQEDHNLVKGISLDAKFYFVHSYYMNPKKSDNVLLKANYGIDFAAGVGDANIVGVQFHPEKSHRYGKQLLTAFANWVC